VVELGNLITSKVKYLLVAGGVLAFFWSCQKAENEILHIIETPSVSMVSPSEVVVTWETDIPGDSRVEYGESRELGKQTTDPEERQYHRIVLTNLKAGRLYYYKVKSVSSTFATEDSSEIDSFQTGEAELHLIMEPEVHNPAPGEWQVVWETDSLSDSRVDYGTTPALGESLYDSTLVRSHSLTFPDLTADTWYYYQVTSTSIFGLSVSSSLDSFQTGSTATELVIVIGPDVNQISENSAAITWSTNISSYGRVEYGPDSAMGSAVTDVDFSVDHTVELSNLEPGVIYYYQVTAISASGDSVTSGIDTFSLASTSNLVFIMNPIANSLSSSEENISWETNLPAWGRINYGPDRSLQYQVEDTTVTTTHDVILSNLLGGTKYYFQVESISQSGATITSAIDSFTTVTGSLNIIGGPDVMIVDRDFFEVVWETDAPAISAVEYGLTEALGSTAVDTVEQTVHDVIVNGLQANTLYYFRVRSFSAQLGAEVVSPLDTVRTAP